MRQNTGRGERSETPASSNKQSKPRRGDRICRTFGTNYLLASITGVLSPRRYESGKAERRFAPPPAYNLCAPSGLYALNSVHCMLPYYLSILYTKKNSLPPPHPPHLVTLVANYRRGRRILPLFSFLIYPLSFSMRPHKGFITTFFNSLGRKIAGK